MSLNRALLLLPLVALGLAAEPALARCRVDIRPLAFGTIDLDRKSYGKGEIVVRCERPTRFEVALQGGAERELVAPSGARLRYRLFADPGHRRPWGDGGGSGATVTAESDGKRPVRLTIYGVIPRQAGKAEGQYVDRLAVTLRY